MQADDDDDDDDDLLEEYTPPDSLRVIWDDPHFEKCGMKGASEHWRCGWCRLQFKSWNATKALAHAAKMKGNDVKICTATMAVEWESLYVKAWNSKKKKKEMSKRKYGSLASSISSHQSEAATTLERSKRSATEAVSKGWLVDPTVVSRLDMACADFVHSLGLSFTTTEDPRFQRILELARHVPKTYRPPRREAVRGRLLNINYDQYQEEATKQMQDQSDV